jgi:hypothetical protein
LLGSSGDIVKRAYNTALVLVRFFGFYLIITGAMGLAYIAFAVAVQVSGAAPWLMDPPLYWAAQGVFGNPIYVVAGILILAKSRAIARYLAKYSEDEGAA